jgi:DNA gyrase subunit B
VRVLAALASMPRLALYRAALEHPVTSGELMLAANLNTTGQLYHHLRELIGAGLLVQEGRDRYAVVPERLPAARTILAAALGIAQAATLASTAA